MGCQKIIAKKIRAKDADYLLAVKGNKAAATLQSHNDNLMP